MSKNNQKNLKTTLIVLMILLVGIVGYLFITGNSSKNPQLENSNSDDVTTMMSKVRMEMPKAEVNQAIGEPYECKQAELATAEDAQHNMEQCNYGDKSATSHLTVTYMDGKVWGTTSASNTAQ